MKTLKKYKALFFDLDGTLTDSCTGILNSVTYALKKMVTDVPTQNELISFIGPPLIDEFKKKFNYSQKQAEQGVAYYREYFREKGIFENSLYDGIEEALVRLKDSGYTLVIATSKPEEFAVKIIKNFNIDNLFTLICGSTLGKSRNQKHQVIAYAIKKLSRKMNISKDEILMIGDRCHDIDGAKRNNIDSMGVLYGYGTEDELITAGADYLAPHVSDILDILC
ncbi:MAG: HAD family hydrolase [Clostridia bacterium]|nr:HAD family hydrolase [Clostridia bacterium]